MKQYPATKITKLCKSLDQVFHVVEFRNKKRYYLKLYYKGGVYPPIIISNMIELKYIIKLLEGKYFMTQHTKDLREYLNTPTPQIIKAQREGKQFNNKKKCKTRYKTPEEILDYLGISKEDIKKAYSEGAKVMSKI